MARKTCIACGEEFDGPVNKIRCKKNCKREHIIAKRQFIGVDGEGVDRPDGTHDYVMLSVGSETLANDDGSALTYDQIFTFLYGQFQLHRDATFIGFFLGYDFIQWTKGFTEKEARSLYHKDQIQRRRKKPGAHNPEPFPVYIGGRWEVDIHAGKRFRLAPHQHTYHSADSGDVNYDHCRTCHQSCVPSAFSDIGPEVGWEEFFPIRKQRARARMFICDTGSFWQSSFMSVIDPKGWTTPVVTNAEYRILEEGKKARGVTLNHGDTTGFDELRRYNVLENEVLARVTAVLNAGFVDMKLVIKPRDWYGPGRAAQLWLDSLFKKKNIDFRTETLEATIPKWITNAAQASYYGGWFEQFMHGHITRPVYEYDINSAYPAVIAKLPCLLHGEWTREEPSDGTHSRKQLAISLVNVTVIGSNRFMGALPHRTNPGRILHPLETQGWYWQHEINAASRAGLIDSVTVHDRITYIPCDCDPPLRDIADLYGKRIGAGLDLSDAERAALKNSPHGKALKLVYNSAYGKFAQTIGNPKYGNPIYASLITAGCRTMILDAIATHPEGAEACTMIATDGVYFTSEHPTLELDPYKLGAWDVTVKYGMTQLMPGVYWDDKSRDAVRDNKALKLKSRGISARDLGNALEDLDNQFTRLATGDTTDWPTLNLVVSFAIISAKQAVMRNRWSTAGKVMHNETRQINSNPSPKRRPEYYMDESFTLRTRPYKQGPTLETVPYDKSFGFGIDDARLIFQEPWGETPDGDLGDLFSHFIRSGGQ